MGTQSAFATGDEPPVTNVAGSGDDAAATADDDLLEELLAKIRAAQAKLAKEEGEAERAAAAADEAAELAEEAAKAAAHAAAEHAKANADWVLMQADPEQQPHFFMFVSSDGEPLPPEYDEEMTDEFAAEHGISSEGQEYWNTRAAAKRTAAEAAEAADAADAAASDAKDKQAVAENEANQAEAAAEELDEVAQDAIDALIAAGYDPDDAEQLVGDWLASDPFEGVESGEIDLSDLDSDGDGLTDSAEEELGTDPLKADTDADHVSDSDEVELGSDPTVIDTDGDGLTDGQEAEMGTNPLESDTDSDGVDDLWETVWGSNPLVPDQPGDASSDEGPGPPLTHRTASEAFESAPATAVLSASSLFARRDRDGESDDDGDDGPDAFETINVGPSFTSDAPDERDVVDPSFLGPPDVSVAPTPPDVGITPADLEEPGATVTDINRLAGDLPGEPVPEGADDVQTHTDRLKHDDEREESARDHIADFGNPLGDLRGTPADPGTDLGSPMGGPQSPVQREELMLEVARAEMGSGASSGGDSADSAAFHTQPMARTTLGDLAPTGPRPKSFLGEDDAETSSAPREHAPASRTEAEAARAEQPPLPVVDDPTGLEAEAATNRPRELVVGSTGDGRLEEAIGGSPSVESDVDAGMRRSESGSPPHPEDLFDTGIERLQGVGQGLGFLGGEPGAGLGDRDGALPPDVTPGASRGDELPDPAQREGLDRGTDEFGPPDAPGFGDPRIAGEENEQEGDTLIDPPESVPGDGQIEPTAGFDDGDALDGSFDD